MQATHNAKPSLDASRLREIRKRLLRWYLSNRRDLPWRRTRDPYAIWVSEIMLQQTRVDTVIPYYEKFLKRYPNVKTLASSPVDELLASWSGLGYYQRARSMHSAAGEMLARYNGKMPEDYESIRTLPGIGPYTAGAILSIAYEKKVPLLDGNVIRLLSRLFALRGDPAEKENNQRLWKLSEALLPTKQIGDFNQALMELPALVCTPRSPRCEECPLEKLCLARAKGIQELLPEKKKKPSSRPVTIAFAIIERDGKIFLNRREKNPMAGMLEFPSVEIAGELFAAEPLRQALQKEFKINADSIQLLGKARHSIMDQRILACYFKVKATIGRTRNESCAMFDLRALESHPITTLTRKGLVLLGG